MQCISETTADIPKQIEENFPHVQCSFSMSIVITVCIIETITITREPCGMLQRHWSAQKYQEKHQVTSTYSQQPLQKILRNIGSPAFHHSWKQSNPNSQQDNDPCKNSCKQFFFLSRKKQPIYSDRSPYYSNEINIYKTLSNCNGNSE